MGKMTWYKISFDEVAQMKKVCDNDHAKIGELFCALMQTAETGETVELSDKRLESAYIMMCVNVERARAAYEKKCEKRVAAGSKGGKAKAAKQKSETTENADDSEPAFKPPSKTEFKDAAKHFCKEYEVSCDIFAATQLYEQLSKAGWTYSGLKIQHDYTWQAIIVAHLCNKANCFEYCSRGELENVTRTLASLGHDFDVETLEYLTLEKSGFNTWCLFGKEYHSLKDAIAGYYEQDEDETDGAEDPGDLPEPSRPYGAF